MAGKRNPEAPVDADAAATEAEAFAAIRAALIKEKMGAGLNEAQATAVADAQLAHDVATARSQAVPAE